MTLTKVIKYKYYFVNSTVVWFTNEGDYGQTDYMHIVRPQE